MNGDAFITPDEACIRFGFNSVGALHAWLSRHPGVRRLGDKVHVSDILSAKSEFVGEQRGSFRHTWNRNPKCKPWRGR